MEFGIALEVDELARGKAYLINELSHSLNQYFKTKDYGEDIEFLIIGIICIKILPGYEKWFKKKKTSYKRKTIIKKLDGTNLELKNIYNYSIKFDNQTYDDFVNSNDVEALKLVSLVITDSLHNLNRLPKLVKAFDRERFETDFIEYFKNIT